MGLSIIASVVLGGALAACGSSSGDSGDTTTADPGLEGDARWKETIAAAEREGVVVFYSSAPQTAIDRLQKAFKDKYPKIDMQPTRVTGLELATALENERHSGGSGADIALHDMVPFQYDNLANFTPPTGPNPQRAEFKREGITLKGVSQMHNIVPFGLAYNTSLVHTPPTDFTALADPSFAGQVGLFDFASPGSADLYGFLVQHYGGEDFLRRVAAGKPQFYPSVAPTLQALTSGEIAITDYASSVAVQDLVDQGAPVKFVPTKPQWAIQFYTYIVGWAKHPNAAQVLYDFMATPAGQQAINKDAISVLPNIPGTVGQIGDVQTMNVENAINANTVNAANARWRAIFGR
ncbi:extracellular solute-binding protein [Amycolatopsis sp. GM8]|uniref:extracellular solute-binding protein n=1 Tax=Amycolatopsis sp. GM8 TaxID=2896530 RepID=UPI001F18B518|nr:extracellular solute-binding protein [Amycolatopsis sp. GM8]